MVFIRHLTGTLSRGTIANSPEILFIVLMISATGAGDLGDLVPPKRLAVICKCLRMTLSFGALVAAALYGVLAYDLVAKADLAISRARLLSASIWLAVIFLSVGLIAQIIAAKIESGKISEDEIRALITNIEETFPNVR